VLALSPNDTLLATCQASCPCYDVSSRPALR
jgi:hypothetical protein